MTRFIIQTRERNDIWHDEAEGDFDTLAEALSAIDSLVEVCDYCPNCLRVIEVDVEGNAEVLFHEVYRQKGASDANRN